MKKLFPLFLQMEGKRCLVVGGGKAAYEKALGLLAAGARVDVISPHLTPSFNKLQKRFPSRIFLHKRIFRPSADAKKSYFLAVIAEGLPTLNEKYSRSCRKKGILTNTVDTPECSDFFSAAQVDRYPLQIAISSHGQAPLLARIIKYKIEQLLPANLGEAAALLSRQRRELKKSGSSPRERVQIWNKMFGGGFMDAVFSGDLALMRKILAKGVTALEGKEGKGGKNEGKVYFVGSGPGDQDLLTIKSHRILQQAEVVLYDHLVSEDILKLVRKDADKINVGKKCGEGGLTQGQINECLVAQAKIHRVVIRLKGGDPTIFGRLGEEIEHLKTHRIPYEVIPGISSGIGCAAALGISLTHRDFSHGVQIITGHFHQNQSYDWEKLADPRQTLMVYMGNVRIRKLAWNLMVRGLDSQTPCAVIANGTREGQTHGFCSLQDLSLGKGTQEVGTPTIYIIGRVVEMARDYHASEVNPFDFKTWAPTVVAAKESQGQG